MYTKKLPIHSILVLITSHWYGFHPLYLSISPVLWHKFMPESVFMDQLHLNKACWELWLSGDQPHSDYNGQWQRALCMVAVLQSSQPNTYRNKKKWKMYAIKQIKICAEYRDMLPRPRLDLSGTPGLRPIGLSPGSWQTSLDLGSEFRYSAEILICITLLRAHVNGTDIVLKSTDRRLNISYFLHVQGQNHGCLTVFISKVIRWNCFSKMWCILLTLKLKITIYNSI